MKGNKVYEYWFIEMKLQGVIDEILFVPVYRNKQDLYHSHSNQFYYYAQHANNHT
jgi:hypothetical protein